MFKGIFKAIFGTKGERDRKVLQPIVAAVNAFEPEIKSLSDEQLQAKTGYFKEQIKEKIGCDPKDLVLKGDVADKNRQLLLSALNDILPEAFAVVREAAWRTIKQRHYDVQLFGGIVLHLGKIAEMKTGEGKTLTSTLPIYLNALTGLGVHVVTVNDYLAQRDAEWMSPIYNFLGMSVGYILTDMEPEERQHSYGCDITYGTNNEYGFDYLRDNMVIHQSLKVQRDFYYCIVDEVDSILIDEARTPLIISGAAEDSTKKYHEIQKIIPRLQPGKTIKQDIDEQLKELTDEKTVLSTKLEKGGSSDVQDKLEEIKQKMKELNKRKQTATINKEINNPLPDGDYIVDEEDRSIYLTPAGISRVEELLRIDNLYSDKNIEWVHHVEQAIRASALFKRDVDYVVKDGEVLIVDEFTGRLMPGRRYSDGLHQALEAKERVHVARENQTLATITFQNYFKMYAKLSGMTGTADTEAEEFNKIYKLDVVVIPTNKPIARKDYPDSIFRTEGEKFQAVANEVAELYRKGQPVLVGTISVERSEKLSRLLKNRNIPHNVLNAKFHGREAEIVAQAGESKKVTIATNMAGRGTDIVLGGNPEMQSRILLENLLKSSEHKVPLDEIKTFIRFILLENRKEVDFLIEKHPALNQELVSKVEKIKEECRADQKRVLEAGGLHILGTERHEARRIDNQLRGRSGRQGDPGSSRFYISMEDDLMRLFGGERLQRAMQWLGMKEGEQIQHKLISNAIARAQTRVESRNFEIRKHLLKYDEVMNEQRTYVYNLRNKILDNENISDTIKETIEQSVDKVMEDATASTRKSLSSEAFEDITKWIENDLRIKVDFSEIDDISRVDYDEFRDNLVSGLSEVYKAREVEMGSASMRTLERLVFINTIDAKWKEHLYEMDYLKEGINWRSYAERDPLVEYKFEGFKMFHQMFDNINSEVLSLLFHAELSGPIEDEPDFDNYFQGSASHDEYGQFDMLTPQEQQMLMEQEAASGDGRAPSAPRPRQQVRHEKVGRNASCPCGSGKKYKHCCYPKYE